jgi:hypothetical protein
MAPARSLTVAAAAAAALAGRYTAGRNRAGKQSIRELDTRPTNLGEVERLSLRSTPEACTWTSRSSTPHPTPSPTWSPTG